MIKKTFLSNTEVETKHYSDINEENKLIYTEWYAHLDTRVTADL